MGDPVVVHFSILFGIFQGEGFLGPETFQIHKMGYCQQAPNTNFKPFDMGPAGKVSPLIRASRWTMLLLGIWWGHHRYNVNFEKERKLREYRHQMQPTWEKICHILSQLILKVDSILSMALLELKQTEL